MRSLSHPPSVSALFNGARATQLRVQRSSSQHICRCTTVETSSLAPLSQDRVLRYPDGGVRVIRYPGSPKAQGPSDDGQYFEEPRGWHICGENDSGCVVLPDEDPANPLPGAAPVGTLWSDERHPIDSMDRHRDSRARPIAPSATNSSAQGADTQKADDNTSSAHAHSAGLSGGPDAPTIPSLPSSPAELLRYLQSDEYKAKREEEDAQVAGGFDILTGCPWVQPRPLLVLATRKAGSEVPVTYTLPTSVPEEGAVDAIAEVLKDPALASKLSMDKKKDGIVCFQNQEQAVRFQDMLEENGYLDVMVSEVDSHELFRMTSAAKVVVISMAAQGFIPTPLQLAAALRRKRAFDDTY